MINVVLHSPDVYTAVLDVCVNLVSRTIDFFKPGNVNYMKNIFLHECRLGRGRKGLMGYEFPPTIRKSDVESTRLLYNLMGKGGKGWPIVDWELNN